jgi:hypothetical protein
VGSGALWEREGASENGRERGGEVGSEVQEVGSMGGSELRGRSHSECGSGSGLGGGGVRQRWGLHPQGGSFSSSFFA